MEVAKLAQAHGFRAQRVAPLQCAGTDDPDVKVDIEGTWLEVKRRETLAIEAWSVEAEQTCPEGMSAVVVYRRSRQPWRASMLLEDFLLLQRELRELREELMPL